MTEKLDLQELLAARYSDATELDAHFFDTPQLRTLAQRGSCRAFRDTPVPLALLKVLCATALASPTKSDLQQRDIILLASPEQRQQLATLVEGQPWVAKAPMLLVFCGNNRRQRLIHDWQDVPFANDHLDAFFNAAADAAIALGAFTTAAEAVGLGCCPISAVRNEAQAVSDLLKLPDHVFPFAGLALGYPEQTPEISKRLPLNVTCHVDHYQEIDLQSQILNYDTDRTGTQPYESQRFTATFGESGAYGWSVDKVRQYSEPERADFGSFVRARGFRLD